MKKIIINVTIGYILGMIITSIAHYSTNPEYNLDIINQEKVKVYSNSTQKSYIVPINEVNNALLEDNL